MSAHHAHILFLNPSHNKWYVLSESNEKKWKNKTFFWGANLVPLHLNIAKQTSGKVPPSHIQMKAFVSDHASKPILGPLIGILSAQGNNGTFRGLRSNYKDIIRKSLTEGGIVFVFTPNQVNWKKHIIHGKLYHPTQKKWITYPFPFPNVVYNRILDRRTEQRSHYQSCISRFQSEPGLTLFNRQFFNKVDVLSRLQQSSKLKAYIPETKHRLTQLQLTYMLKKYPAIYLKPAEGKAGAGIMKIIKTAHRTRKKEKYGLYYFDKKKTDYLETNMFRSLWQHVRQRMISSTYMIQQAIPLAKINDCPFDCRVLVQKNGRGKWDIAGLGLRVAGSPKSMTTHVPRGGRIENSHKVLSSQVTQHIHQLCLFTAKTLDRYYPPLGEMTIDVGLTKKGNPWIFEANSKPMKFDEPHIRNEQLANVIRYAHYLTFK